MERKAVRSEDLVIGNIYLDVNHPEGTYLQCVAIDKGKSETFTIVKEPALPLVSYEPEDDGTFMFGAGSIWYLPTEEELRLIMKGDIS